VCFDAFDGHYFLGYLVKPASVHDEFVMSSGRAEFVLCVLESSK
jgi:hypothetical protein